MGSKIQLLIAFSAMLASCAGFQNLHSDKYVQAGIQIAANPNALSGMLFVKKWSSEFGSTYTKQDVGVIVANQLADQGWHDVWVSVGLLSREAYENEYEDPSLQNAADRILSPTSSTIEAGLNIWQISIFRSNQQDFFSLAATGTGSQVREAIKAGANVNARDPRDGLTPLMTAAETNPNPDVVTALLTAGADAKTKDSAGKTAFEHAQTNEKLKGTDAYRQLQEASE
ncbi:MAG: ankyrin repeat domain-containing protein [Spirochaetia bacterium]|jgi:hypothetical protein